VYTLYTISIVYYVLYISVVTISLILMSISLSFANNDTLTHTDTHLLDSPPDTHTHTNKHSVDKSNGMKQSIAGMNFSVSTDKFLHTDMSLRNLC
jgi:hypothetical protein